MNAAYLIVGALWQLFIVRFISGVAMGVIGTATGTFVATIVPRHLHGRGIAYYSMSTALALCFGPFIGIALLGTIDYTGIFTFFDLGLGMAPYLSGYLVEPVGYAGIFGLNAALVALTIPLYWYVWTYRRAKPAATGEELPLDKPQE